MVVALLTLIFGSASRDLQNKIVTSLPLAYELQQRLLYIAYFS